MSPHEYIADLFAYKPCWLDNDRMHGKTVSKWVLDDGRSHHASFVVKMDHPRFGLLRGLGVV